MAQLTEIIYRISLGTFVVLLLMTYAYAVGSDNARIWLALFVILAGVGSFFTFVDYIISIFI